jgi:ketosteroid isomerase-like protein
MWVRVGVWTVWLGLAAIGCHDGGPKGQTALGASAAFRALDHSHFDWMEAECNDGELDLAKLGFERELTLELRTGSLMLTFDTELATQGCFSTAVWAAKPGNTPELWRFEPQALVTLPADAKCGAVERDARDGALVLSGDMLEVVTHGSPWCRGFDARFVYRRSEPKRLDPQRVVTRYVAAFNRADAVALAALFVDTGSLVEPFTRTEDGNYKRHDGRDAVRAWYEAAFRSTPWHALRLTSIEPGTAEGQLIAQWEYMDGGLTQPLRGRNLFVIAGGEIYETELQLIDDPKPSDAPAPAPGAVSATDYLQRSVARGSAQVP